MVTKMWGRYHLPVSVAAPAGGGGDGSVKDLVRTAAQTAAGVDQRPVRLGKAFGAGAPSDAEALLGEAGKDECWLVLDVTLLVSAHEHA